MSEALISLGGWPGIDAAERVWDKIGASFADFLIVGAGNATVDYRMLWEVNRSVLGHDTPNYAQEVGDCVSFGAKNAIEYVACQEIKAGDAEEWHAVFPPYLYATGRVFIGQGQMRGEDGSVGSWQAKAVEQYGVLRADLDGVPKYAGAIAKQWGDAGPPKIYVPEGQKHLIQTTSRIRSWDAAVQALVNYYPLTVASNQGFEMTARSDGFHWPKGTWGHQMCVVGVDNNPKDPYVCILNSWGDVHGVLKDLRNPSVTWPKGTLRVRRSVFEKMIASGEVFSYSRFQGYPTQDFSFTTVV